jgi:hypothetical protein
MGRTQLETINNLTAMPVEEKGKYKVLIKRRIGRRCFGLG